jgi:tetratricopeptide (TPR) repeat protein
VSRKLAVVSVPWGWVTQGKLMRHKLLPALIGVVFACVTHGPAFASNNKAMDADIHSVELQWEHIKFDEDGSPNQFAHIDALANFTATLVEKYPGRPEPLIWEGIVTSEEAGMANTLSAMGYAKKAKSILEEAYQENPAALDAGAPTSLGVLYYRVPGFPFGFGDNDKARQLLAQAVSLAPNGMDANYFYADFLMGQHEYASAFKILKHALALPPQTKRPLWDKNRRAVIKELMAKAQAQAASN